jgi:hypothetical protein
MANWSRKHPEGNSRSGRKFQIGKRNNSTPGSNRGKPARFRVACGECPVSAGEPMYVYVASNARKAVCPSGHVTDCSGGCKLEA